MMASVRKSEIARARSKTSVLTQWETKLTTDDHHALKSPRHARRNERKNDKDHAETTNIINVVTLLEMLVVEGQNIRL